MYKQVLEEVYKHDKNLLSKIKDMREINNIIFIVYKDKEDSVLNLTKSDSPGTLETMLDTINFIGTKVDPSLMLSYIRKSKSYDDGIEMVFKTKSKNATIVSDAIGVAGVALSNYLERIRKNFNLESYL